MEIQVFKQSTATPAIWNHEELKAAISAKMEDYKNLVFTEETQTDAKKYRAALNKLIEALKGFAREEKQKALAEYERTTKKQIDELIAIILPCRDQIDANEKNIAEAKKQEKLEKIKSELYAPMIDGLADLIPYDKLHDKRWLNVSFSMTAIGTEMAQKIERIVAGLDAIDKMNLDAALTEQTKATFLEDFDLAAAIKKTERLLEQRAALERLRADAEAKKAAESENAPAPKYTPLNAETPTAARFSDDNTAEPIHTVVFRIRVTESKLKLLGQFMRENCIRPERV